MQLPLLGTLQHPPVSSLVNRNVKCHLTQGCITLTGTPSVSLRRKKHVEKRTKGEEELCHVEGGQRNETQRSVCVWYIYVPSNCKLYLFGECCTSLYRTYPPSHSLFSKSEYVHSLVGTTESECIGTRNTITGLSYDSELTRGHETLTGAPTAALRRRRRLDEGVVSKTSDIQDGSSKLGLLEILDLAKVIVNLEHIKFFLSKLYTST